jgi:hypothetical protein
MTNSENDPRPPHETVIDEVLMSFVDQFRDQLAQESRRLAAKDSVEVNAAHVMTANENLTQRDSVARRDSQAVISTAFQENQMAEWLSYGMAGVMFVLGIVLILSGTFGSAEAPHQIAKIIGGSITQVLVVFPMRFAYDARRHNIAIRMFGSLLDRTTDAKTIAALVKQILNFVTHRR